MYVKTPAKVAGIPTAQVAVSPGVTDLGAGQINAVISALDAHGFPTVVASLRCSLNETRELIAQLAAALFEAQRMEDK